MKKRISIAVLAVGIITLIAGVVVLVVNLLSGPKIQDAEFLVSAGSFAREDVPGVIWDFTEVGKGTLTTNAHENDYDFIWAIEGDKLVIETDWLYDLNNSYVFKIDQEAGTLTLVDGETEIKFQAIEDKESEPEVIEEEAAE